MPEDQDQIIAVLRSGSALGTTILVDARSSDATNDPSTISFEGASTLATREAKRPRNRRERRKGRA